MTKQEEVRRFIERRVRAALAEKIAQMPDRITAETLRVIRRELSECIAYVVAIEEYSFIELADIMEWKRTRVRR